MDRGYANFQIESTQVAIAPGEGRHLHHGQRRTRARSTRSREVKLAGTIVVPRGGAASAAAGPAGRDLQPQADHHHAGADAEPPGARRLRLRQGRPGADRRTTPTTTCRSRSSSTRATASTCATSRSPAPTASTTRCCGARCASWRAAGCRIPRSSAPSSACSACRTSRRWSSRPPRWPARRTWWTWTSRSRRGRRQFAGGIGYSETASFMLNGSYVHSNFMGTGKRVAVELNGGAVQQGLQLPVHQPVHHHRRPAAHDLADLSATSRSSSRRPRTSPRRP